MNSTETKIDIQESGYDFPYHYLDLKIDEYKYYFHVEYLHYLSEVKKQLAPYDGQLILDAGCGDGRFAYEMRNENVKIVGLDLSPRAIAFARAFNTEGEFLVQDLLEFQPGRKFDQIVLIETLEHIPPSGIPAILQKLSEHLADGGKFVVTVPSTNLPLISKHYQHFTEKTLRAALEQYFAVNQCYGCGKLGLHSKAFMTVRKISKFALMPFIAKSSVIRRYFTKMTDYYARNLGVGTPAECVRIIAVCEKDSPRAD